MSEDMSSGTDYDYIVVGGGSAGCVLASRLSENPASRVLLLEAGRDTPPGKVPPDILDSYPHSAYYNQNYHWKQLRASKLNGAGQEAAQKYEQGRIMGGSSSINGMMAVRGLPSDFQAWTDAGAQGWSWDDVLPFFTKLERDLDFGGNVHGKEGRIPIRRVPRDVWPGFSQAACTAMQNAGYDYRQDHNADFNDGIFPMPINNLNDQRVTAAEAYLDKAVRNRPNLTIRPNAIVDRIGIENGRATHLTFRIGSETLRHTAREIIVSCGTFHSPTLLMRSGIGAGDHLRDHGIAVHADLPGVGQNLQDHPTISLGSFIKNEGRMPDTLRRHLHFGLRYSSGHADCPGGDMYVLPVNQVAWHAIGKRFGVILLWVNRSFSRGSVRLDPSNIQGEPSIALNLLSDSRDMDRLVSGFHKVAGFFRDPQLRSVAPEPFAAAYSEKVRKLGQETAMNGFITAIGAMLMDGSGVMRRAIVSRLVSPDGDIARLLENEDRLREWIRRNVTHGWHATGTCKIGSRMDRTAVVDSECRVHGMANLRVVDASVMPSVVSANTNLTTMMIAEKIAHRIQEQEN